MRFHGCPLVGFLGYFNRRVKIVGVDALEKKIQLISFQVVFFIHLRWFVLLNLFKHPSLRKQLEGVVVVNSRY